MKHKTIKPGSQESEYIKHLNPELGNQNIKPYIHNPGNRGTITHITSELGLDAISKIGPKLNSEIKNTEEKLKACKTN